MKFIVNNNGHGELTIPVTIGQLFLNENDNKIYTLAQIEISHNEYTVILRLCDDQRKRTTVPQPVFTQLDDNNYRITSFVYRNFSAKTYNIKGDTDMTKKFIYLNSLVKDFKDDIIKWATIDYKDTFFPSYYSKNTKEIDWNNSQYAVADLYTINSFDFDPTHSGSWTGGSIVGFIIVGEHFESPFERKFIMVIFPEYRRQHIGQQAVNALSQMLSATGAIELYGFNNKSDTNSKFLEKCGFSVIDSCDGNLLYQKNTMFIV